MICIHIYIYNNNDSNNNDNNNNNTTTTNNNNDNNNNNNININNNDNNNNIYVYIDIIVRNKAAVPVCLPTAPVYFPTAPVFAVAGQHSIPKTVAPWPSPRSGQSRKVWCSNPADAQPREGLSAEAIGNCGREAGHAAVAIIY